MRHTDVNRVKALIICVLAAVAFPLAAQHDNTVDLSVDWEAGRITIEVGRPIDVSGTNLPTAVSRGRRAVEREAPGLIVEALRRLPYDSLHTVDEVLAGEPNRIETLHAISRRAVPVDSRASVDLTHVIVSFELDLYRDVIALLSRHGRAIPIEGRLGWLATADYSGIVIYAAGELDLHGTPDTAEVSPALFPGLYYRNGDGVVRLMESGYVEPEYLERWGPVMYSADVFSAELNDRIGPNPLRIIAYGCFGKYPTDIVIANPDAQQILATESNLRLIAEGRIAIVVDPENL